MEAFVTLSDVDLEELGIDDESTRNTILMHAQRVNKKLLAKQSTLAWFTMEIYNLSTDRSWTVWWSFHIHYTPSGWYICFMVSYLFGFSKFYLLPILFTMFYARLITCYTLGQPSCSIDSCCDVCYLLRYHVLCFTSNKTSVFDCFYHWNKQLLEQWNSKICMVSTYPVLHSWATLIYIIQQAILSIAIYRYQLSNDFKNNYFYF